MPDNKNQQNSVVPEHDAKKAYLPPELREYGNIAELTKGTGLALLDIAVQGSLTVAATVL